MASALCFAGGFFIAALGVHLHNLWIVYFGYGFVGGIGLGIGYISPVSTLIKWFPDRRGVATGMAIMGFGGGAMIASPMSVALMDHFKASGTGSLGVAATFLTLGVIYLLFMQFGVWTIRVPADDWAPAGYVPNAQHSALITTGNVSADNALKTPQFWLLWVVLLTNVTAGIGVLETASPLIQDTFSDKYMGAGKGVTAAAAAGFVGLLSLFNLLGRFFWSSASDKLGRKTTYAIYFGLGIVLYALIPTAGRRLAVGPVRHCGLRDYQHVRRRFRHHSGLPLRPVRQVPSGRHSRPPTHGLEYGRRTGAAHRQLPAREPQGRGLHRRGRLPNGVLHHGRAAGGGPAGQLRRNGR